LQPLSPQPYPSAFLEKTWKEVLLYQFHDILPGSSIKRVYDESLPRCAHMLSEVEARTQALRSQVAENIEVQASQSPPAVKRALCFNSLSWERSAWITCEGKWIQVRVPPLGFALVETSGSQPEPASLGLTAAPDCLENELLCVRFAEDGSITSVFDKKAQREAIRPGQPANRLAVYRDHGDAWDFPLDYANQTPGAMQLISAEPRLAGPRAILKQVYRYAHSVMVQEISLESSRAWLEFDCRLTWRETAAMLRTSFPVNVHAEAATFEIQFGSIQRPTHRNTTWDLAKDEVPGHKFADLSQGDYGVALLNDSKYGYKVKDGVIDLNLLRSVPYPRPTPGAGQPAEGEPDLNFTDQSEHAFRYALYPHTGDAVDGKERRSGEVSKAGYEFNYPLGVIPIVGSPQSNPPASALPASFSLCTVSAANVIVEAVKKAEDRGSLILRLYEACHAGALAEIRFGVPVDAAFETDLLENRTQVLALDGNRIQLVFQPYEIKTIEIMLAAAFTVT
jgi:alpha-mannosidase